MKRCSRLGLCMALALATPAAAQSRPLPGADAFAPLRGPYDVGVRDLLWVDSARAEPFTRDPGDHRRLLVRVWYPADRGRPAQWGERALYIGDLGEFGDVEKQRRLPYSLARPHAMRVRSHAVADRPLAAREARYPVLVYHHGGGQPRFSATFLTEQLASEGYVVVAVDHPGLSPTAAYPDGSRFLPDTLLPPAEPGDYLERVVFPIWTADAAFVLDRLEAIDGTPGQPFFGRLALGRIGMLGWSFGGATAVQLSRDDSRVRAAVNHDGSLFGDVRERGTTKPVMMMHDGGDAFRAYLDRSSGDGYDIAIAGAGHAYFSDGPLFSSTLPPENIERVHEIIVAYTLAFFDRYLRDAGSALLAGPSADQPEVTFRKK